MGVTGILLSHNLFSYCYNNPVNMIDSSGQTATVKEWVQQTSWLAAIWGVALAEPTFIGEIVAGVVTVVGYVIVQTTVNNQTTTTANAQATTSTAQVTTSTAQISTASSSMYEFSKPSFSSLELNMKHILNNHGPNGPKEGKTFFKGMTIEMIRRAIEEAYNNGTIVKAQGIYNRLVEGYSKTYDIIIRMWIHLDKDLINTAYPTGGLTQ